jgi:N-acetylgalactosamine-6-sulfatase
VTTTTQVDHRDYPILYNIAKDPGEKYPIKPLTQDYVAPVKILRQIVQMHEQKLVPGKPQLNWCDSSVMVS